MRHRLRRWQPCIRPTAPQPATEAPAHSNSSRQGGVLTPLLGGGRRSDACGSRCSARHGYSPPSWPPPTPSSPRCSPPGESWLTAAIPNDNPYCSCKLTRVRSTVPPPRSRRPNRLWRRRGCGFRRASGRTQGPHISMSHFLIFFSTSTKAVTSAAPLLDLAISNTTADY